MADIPSVACTAHRCLDSYAWKVCDTHGRFPVWLGQCPESGIFSTGDALMDMCIDRLFRPGSTLPERDSARRVVALALRDTPSRLERTSP